MIAIVIPVGPKEECWKELIKNYSASYKIYLAIGNRNQDEFIEELNRYPEINYKLINSAPGRASQQNEASKFVQEKFILFLHSDSKICNIALEKLPNIINNNIDTIWYFNLYFTCRSFLMRITEIGVKIRCALFNLPFGDQGFLVKKELFLKLNGFPNKEIGEDLLFIRNGHKAKIKIKSLKLKIGTSARKYEGKWLVTTKNHIYWTIKLYFGGN